MSAFEELKRLESQSVGAAKQPQVLEGKEHLTATAYLDDVLAPSLLASIDMELRNGDFAGAEKLLMKAARDVQNAINLVKKF